MAVTHPTVAGPNDATKQVSKTVYELPHTIDDGSFVAAKLSATATDILFGRSTAAAGNGEEIVCTAAGRALIDDAAASNQRTTLGLGTIATQNANNVAITGGALSATVITLNNADPAATGNIGYNQTTNLLEYYNSQRALADTSGWAAYADPPGFNSFGGNFGTALALAASGGTALIPIVVTAHMLADTLIIRNTDVATARSAEWSIYTQALNNGNAGENTLAQVSASLYGTFSFTPGAASTQTSQATTPPIYLPPGVYWLALRNTSGAQTFGLGTTAAGGFAPNVFQTKTLVSALTTTLDAVAATWTKSTAMPGVRLQGRVFGQATVF